MKKVFSLTTLFFLLAVVGAGAAGKFYKDNQVLVKEVATLKSDPTLKAKDETKVLVEKLASLVVLPTGEDPVVATVTDKDKLKGQAIFADAENGDKLIIYALAKKAYLYDEKNNKIKNIIPVNIGDVAGASTSATPKAGKVTPTPKATPTEAAK